MDRHAGGRRFSREEFLKTAASGAVLAGCAGVTTACGVSRSPELFVEPRRVRADETFVARLEGLSPGERAVLSASFADEFLQEWSSTVVFEADAGGRVDTSTHAPVEGSYGLVDPAGPVWSALGANFYVPSTGSTSVTVEARVGDREMSAEVARYAMGEGVETADVRENGLFGRLFIPDASAGPPAPGVLVLGGSDGGLPPYVAYEAALLASHGFAALALAYFTGDRAGAEIPPGLLPQSLAEIPLEYFGGALEWLGRREEVDPERLGVVGHSRGGELALLLGANYPSLKAVVSYVGSGVASPSLEGDEAAWTSGGDPVPYLRSNPNGSRPSEEEIRRAEIPVERTNGPVLLVAGDDDDALWPSDLLSRVAYDRLKRHDRPHEDELVVYRGAGHLIGAPYAPTAPGRARFGGNAKANAEACEDSWGKVLSLLGGRLKG